MFNDGDHVAEINDDNNLSIMSIHSAISPTLTTCISVLLCPIRILRARKIAITRYINTRIRSEEVRWSQEHRMDLHRPASQISTNPPSPSRWTGSTHITGQSSTLGLCVNANTDHNTTSSFSISSARSTISCTPPTSSTDWKGYSPAAHSS